MTPGCTADPPHHHHHHGCRVQAPEQRGWRGIKPGFHTGKKEIPIRDANSWAAPAPRWGRGRGVVVVGLGLGGRRRARARRVGGERGRSVHVSSASSHKLGLSGKAEQLQRVYLRRRRPGVPQMLSQTLLFCLAPPPLPSTVTLNSRNGACPVAKEDDCKAPRLVEKKIPEGDLLLQVSPPPLTSRFCPRGSTCSQPDPPLPPPEHSQGASIWSNLCFWIVLLFWVFQKQTPSGPKPETSERLRADYRSMGLAQEARGQIQYLEVPGLVSGTLLASIY